MSLSRILIVDDEKDVRSSLRGILEDEGHKVFEAENAARGLELISDANPDLVLMDIWMPGEDGLKTLPRMREIQPDLPVIMISGHGSIETAVSAIRLGAYDFVEKPLSLEKVLLTVNRALELGDLLRKNQSLAASLSEQTKLIGNSPPMLEFKNILAKVAASDSWALLRGESGSGKELAARAIHAGSSRANQALVAVNCAAIPEELIESALFGHEKGAFTGAIDTRRGHFEMAHKGTLFLDEIADMSLKTQARILRILQEQTFERVGGSKKIHVDVRVIAATNKNLEEAIAAGSFRADLYYRLAVVPLFLPPLRERGEDIDLLTEAFAIMINPAKPLNFSAEAMRAMRSYCWPGNVRELRNIVERMSILHSGQTVKQSDLPPEIRGKKDTSTQLNSENYPEEHIKNIISSDMDFKEARFAFEAWYLEEKLKESRGNITRLAEITGLERSYLHRKLKACHIDSKKIQKEE